MKGDYEMTRLYQRILIDSYEARMLAVREMTKSGKTKDPGLAEPWATSAEKAKGAAILTDFMYEADPRKTYKKYEDKSKKDRFIATGTY